MPLCSVISPSYCVKSELLQGVTFLWDAMRLINIDASDDPSGSVTRYRIMAAFHYSALFYPENGGNTFVFNTGNNQTIWCNI